MSRRIARSLPVAFLAVLPLCAVSAAEREQLSQDVRPVHYDLDLIPDAANLVFHTHEGVAVDVSRTTPAIEMNAVDLVFDRVAIDGGKPGSVQLDAKLQRATLTFDHPVEPGRHTLAIDYHGAIKQGTAAGFFALDSDTDQGKKRVLETNFEPADARSFFPSWDQPDMKATFTITVETSSDRS
jgi:aminopeptidase N